MHGDYETPNIFLANSLFLWTVIFNYIKLKLLAFLFIQNELPDHVQQTDSQNAGVPTAPLDSCFNFKLFIFFFNSDNGSNGCSKLNFNIDPNVNIYNKLIYQLFNKLFIEVIRKEF